MTPVEQLEKLVEARKNATAGPWQTHAIWGDDNETVISRGIGQVDGMGLNHGDDGYELFTKADAAFIALAGSVDLAAILAHVKAMDADAYARGVRDAAQKVLDLNRTRYTGEIARAVVILCVDQALALLDGKGEGK